MLKIIFMKYLLPVRPKLVSKLKMLRIYWNLAKLKKALLIIVIYSYRSLLKYFSFAEFLVTEGNEQGALQKEPFIAPFIEQFKATSLRKVYW